jgi:TolB-like protein/DNA-binding winged helix-turn-helix (wHTH) protein/Flp pilus assembly protein TadD
MEVTAATARSSAERAYRVDDLIIDVGRQRVMRGDTDIPLSGLSFELLLALVREAPNLVSYDRLMELVWPGLVVSPETVTQRVKLVRDALGDDSHAPRYILGMRGRGYRMLAAVEPFVPEKPPAHQDLPEHPPTSPPTPTQPDAQRSRIGLAIGVVVIVLAGVFAAVRWWMDDPATSNTALTLAQPERTIAVLPLMDLSPEGGNQYLGDGLAEELAYRLATIPGLRVASSTSAFAFKGRQGDVRRIAQSLGVRHVLEGNVRRDGDRLRVTASLIDARTGFSVWTQQYNRDRKDLLAIHDELARSIVDKLQLVLSRDAARRLAQSPTADPGAFDRYLVGLANLRKPTSEQTLDDAEQAFREALEIDALFGRAHAGLCETHALRYQRTRDRAIATQAEAACNEALQLDASASEVERALANLFLLSGQGDRAVAIFRAAVEREPGNADGHIGLARALEQLKDTAQAEATYRRAIDVEPGYWAARSAIGKFYVQHGRAEDAIPHLQAATELVPASALAFNNLGAAMQMSGDFADAARAFERSLQLEPTRSAYSNTGTMYYFLGRFADAAEMYRKATSIASEDHRLWGNLGDALHQIEGRRAEATRTYQRAIVLAERDLDVNIRDSVGWAQLAFYNARVGEHDSAQRNIARALELSSDLVWVHYYAALVALESENQESALKSLQRALELGYPSELVRVTPDFKALRADGRFQRLVASNGPNPK